MWHIYQFVKSNKNQIDSNALGNGMEMEIQWGISENLKQNIVCWPTDFRSIIVHANFVFVLLFFTNNMPEMQSIQINYWTQNIP